MFLSAQNANKVVQLCPPLPSDDAGAEFVDLMIRKILVVCNFAHNFLCSQTRWTKFDKEDKQRVKSSTTRLYKI